MMGRDARGGSARSGRGMTIKKDPVLTRRELLGLGAALPLGTVVAAGAARAADACGRTPRQTSGPFFPAFDQVDKDVDLTRVIGHDGRAEGEVIRVRGRVLDEQCRPVEGALVDLWQANAKGRYSHPADRNPAPLDPNFQGWGQAVTDAEGRYSFTTISPGAYPLEFAGGEADARRATGRRTCISVCRSAASPSFRRRCTSPAKR